MNPDQLAAPAEMAPLGVGLHYGIPAARYHGDPCPTPSLSSGVARTLLSQSPAAAYREHPRLGGKKESATKCMNTGALVHSMLAGNNGDFEIGNFDSFRSGAAKAWRDGVIASGRNAVLEHELTDARAIVASLRANVCNGGISNDPFAPHGKSEVTVVWQEGETYCRALIDRMLIDVNGCVDVWDWKVTSDISDETIQKHVARFGYHIQECFYRRGLIAALSPRAPSISWTFAFVLDVEPYTVRRVCLSEEYRGLGNLEVGKAIRLWQKCMAANDWPDGSEQTLRLDPKPWQFGDEISDSIAT